MVLTLERAVADPMARLARVARNNHHDAPAQQAYGTALCQSGRAGDALPFLERAAALRPDVADHQIDLSAAYWAVDRLEDAYTAATEAHRLDLSHPKAVANIAALHLFWQEPAEAAAWYRKAIELDPQAIESWTAWLFCLDLLSETTPERALAARRQASAFWETPVKRFRTAHTNDRDPERRLRIGFTGGDFRDHSAAYTFGPIFDHLDRERYWTAIYADLTTSDQVTEWFKRSTNGWRDVTGWDDLQIAAAVRHDKIDVLVDLAGFSDKSHIRVHMLKPAPLSMTAWGYLTGTGLDCMDAILADAVMLPPEREDEVTERVLRVPYALGFSALKQMVEIVARPERPLTFGYLGRGLKISDETVRLWAAVLAAYPESRLVLKEPANRHARVSTSLLARFAAHGVDAARIELRGHSPRIEHLAAYNDIDVALDPTPQGGGQTTLEALWMGTPTVTLLGERIGGRASASAVTAIGRPEWVATSADEYVALAGRVADQGGDGLRERFLGSPICDEVGRTRAFEEAVRTLWRDYVKETA